MSTAIAVPAQTLEAVERLEGKFKLSQNRRREDVDGVAAALEREGQPELAALMREHAPESR